jgi:hypothetical protein
MDVTGAAVMLTAAVGVLLVLWWIGKRWGG